MKLEVLKQQAKALRAKRLAALISLASLVTCSTAYAQSLQNMPSQVYGGSQGATTGSLTGTQPGGVGSNIWNSVAPRVPIGTLLSGVLEDDLSSGKNQKGDVFAIRLEDGYFKNGVEVIPRHSRIVGAVINVVPSKLTSRGNPGQLQINLQTIVFPDGSNTPLSGFIVHNPNMDMVQNPRKTSAADAAAYYPKAAARSLSMVGRTLTGRMIGFKPGYVSKGPDFKLEKGEVLAVRLNRSLDLSHMSPPPTGFAPQPMPFDPNAPTMQGLRTGQPLPPGLVMPPSLGSGSPAPSAVGNGMPPLAPQVQSKTGTSPNQVFDNPVGPRPGLNMPDPF